MDLSVRFWVDGSRSLIHHQHLSVLQNGTGQADQLALSNREVAAACGHFGRKLSRQAVHAPLHACLVECRPDVHVIKTVDGVQIVAQSPCEQNGLLGNDGQLASEVAEADLAEWQGKVEERRTAVPALRGELAGLKRASGRVEEEADAPTTARKEVDLFKLQEMRDDE